MNRVDCTLPARHHRGFSLIELLMAIMILAIGLISVAALFPAGIIQQQRAKDDVDGPTVAKAAMDIIRSRLSQEDFGAWPDFYTEEELQGGIPKGPAYYLRKTDWPWQRPAIVDPNVAPGLRGTVDVFNSLALNPDYDPDITVTDRNDDSSFFKAFQSRAIDENGGVDYLGIPYAINSEWPANPTTNDANRLRPPTVLFGQSERRWPPDDGSRRAAQYYWDFMFRRHGGKVYVAVFVYRAVKSGGGSASWAVEPLNGEPVIPIMQPLEYGDRWAPGHGDGLGPTGDVMPLPGTTGDFDPADPNQSWQYPAQYIIDNLAQIHRVARGRARPNQVFEDGHGVRLEYEVPPIRIDAQLQFDQGASTVEIMPHSMSEILPYQGTMSQWFEEPGILSGGFIVESQDSVVPEENVDVVDRLWFIPRTVTSGGQQWELIPAFVQVEQL